MRRVAVSNSRNVIWAARRACSTVTDAVSCKGAFCVLLGTARPEGVVQSDLKSVQRLYYLYVKQHHPDSGGNEEMMKRGNAAYMTLRSADDQTRAIAAKQLSYGGASPEKFVDDRQSSRARQPSRPEGSKPFWESGTFTTLEEKEYREFLESLEGTDQIRFHRTFRSPSGVTYRGVKDRNSNFTAKEGERTFHGAGGVRDADATTRSIVAFCLIATLICYTFVLLSVSEGVVKKVVRQP